MKAYTFEADEINKMIYCYDDDSDVKLKVHSDQGSTKWLNVTKAQLEAIMDIFMGEDI